jgi:hypothetical protein
MRNLLIIGLVSALAACSGADYAYPERTGGDKTTYDPVGSNKQVETVFGPGGLSLFGGSRSSSGTEGGVGIGVNSFLWRASLDTIAFMPLSSADPFGGVIITDWFSPANTPNERFKVNVYILDRALRADGVKVAVFKQVRQGDGWADSTVSTETPVNLENAILARARQLRIDQAGL